MRLGPLGLIPVALLLTTACGAPKTDSGSSTSSGASSCTEDGLRTTTAGKFTVGTDSPAYAPWFSGNSPKNGKGYESAVAYAVAKKLGYDAGDVTWITVPFTSAFVPGPKKFDIDLNQVSINAARKQQVDFSSGYYTVTQAVVTYPGSPIEKSTAVAALRGATLGAQVGSTSYSAITDQIKPDRKPQVYNTNDEAIAALKAKLIDGLVVDLPTAFTVVATQLTGGRIVGQLPAAGSPEQFGAVLAKGSPLTQCVTQAVDGLRKDGTLARLEKQWLTGYGAPKLR